jgi:hypothetical protein
MFGKIIHKLFLITCIAGFATAAATTGHAGNPGVPETVAGPKTHQTAPRRCPKAHRPADRLPVYKRYLKRTRTARLTPRRG